MKQIKKYLSMIKSHHNIKLIWKIEKENIQNAINYYDGNILNTSRTKPFFCLQKKTGMKSKKYEQDTI
ncbi:hypothetical protein [Candidatus Photodesmus anomalopis]|uniref:hypothetical protein n=1 Tax=Candidatus Photodesmus anomalopis TaxID=28176 RepID=UPI000419BD24|nr:hypothetical protein [Candidatus Photodesmus katoptron]